MTFQRDQPRLAQQRWPGEYTQPEDDYYTNAENRWREIRDGGVPTITIVPANVHALSAFANRHGGSPTVPATDTLAWPPERNAACWCGSGRKYKKCCGRPG